MKKILLVGMAVLALASCNQEKGGGIQYMPFQESEKSNWGLIDASGQVLLTDEYEQMPTVVMHDRFFVKNKKGLWELYTAEAKPKQIGDEYSQAGVFVENVAPVVQKDKQIEFIDVDGNVKFTLDKVDGKVVSSCTNFKDGVAIFQVDQYYGCINPNGDVVVEPDYLKIYPASEGKMLAVHKKQEKYLQSGDLDQVTYTILSTKGEELGTMKSSKFKLTDGIFQSGVMVVTDDAGDGSRRVGLVDQNGDWVLKPSDKVKGIKAIQGKQFIFTDGEQQGVMDFEGNVLIRPRYADIVFANSTLFFAKADKSEAGYELMDINEKQIGKDEYMNVLPFMGANAIVQESQDNWIFINTQGEDLKVKQDVYSISNKAMGDAVVQNEYFDFDNIISSLKLTQNGFLDLNLNMGAEAMTAALAGLAADEESDATGIQTDAEDYAQQMVVSAGLARENIAMTVSSTFDEVLAEGSDSAYHFKSIKPNQIGLDIPTTMALMGKSGQLARAIINKVKTLGQVVKENPNAAIVNVGDASYFVANTGTHVFVVYGYLDVSQIDINQYQNVKEGLGERIKMATDQLQDDYYKEFADTLQAAFKAIGEAFEEGLGDVTDIVDEGPEVVE